MCVSLRVGTGPVCSWALCHRRVVCNPRDGAEYEGGLLSVSQGVECAAYCFLWSLALSGAVSQDVGQSCSFHQNCGRITIPHLNVLVMGDGEGEESDHGGVFFWQFQQLQLHECRLFPWLSTQLAFGVTHSF